MEAGSHRVVVVGGGFGGLYAVQALRRVPVAVTLIDRRNFHCFQPLLYQVATGALSPAEIAAPLRGILRRQANATVLMGEVIDVDIEAGEVVLTDGRVPYDSVVFATGATHHYFGNDAWAAVAPGLKTIEDATTIRHRLLNAFERAERVDDLALRRAYLTFVVIGAGPTGAELAGAMSEIANETLRHDFRRIDPGDARVILIEAADRVLPPYAPGLSAKAAAQLRRLDVEVRTGTRVTDIDAEGVTLEAGGQAERIATRTVVWAAGVQASPLGRVVAGRFGASLDRAGRVQVGHDLTVPGHPNVFVIGDMAAVTGPDGRALPGVAPVAMQQGRYVAHAIAARVAGGAAPPFRYRDKGSMATIGRGAAVAQVGPLQLSGYPAWLAWLLIHLMYLVEFENRLLVLLRWAWSYLTWNRGARLITGPTTAPPHE